MVLQITNVEGLMLKDAVSAPQYYYARYTEHERKMLSDKLNRVFEEQYRHKEIKNGIDATSASSTSKI